MNKLFLVLPLLLLTGCFGSQNVKYITDTNNEYIVPGYDHPAMPEAINAREVEWKVLNKEKLQELLNSLGPNEDIALFVLTSKGYENLSLNIADALRWIKSARGIIVYYRYTVPEQQKVLADELNKAEEERQKQEQEKREREQ